MTKREYTAIMNAIDRALDRLPENAENDVDENVRETYEKLLEARNWAGCISYGR